MGARVPDGYFNQTYMVEFEVPGALDGTTPSPDIDFAEGNDDPQQIFRPEVEGNLGLIDVDYLVSSIEGDNTGTRGNRWVGIFWLDASVAGDPGATLEVVDAITGAPVTQEAIANLNGLTRFYRRSGILVPQGSLLRINGFAAGATPHRIRIHISQLTDDGLLFAQNVLCCVEQSGGGGGGTGFDLENVLQNGDTSGGEDLIMTGGGTLRLQSGSDIEFNIGAGGSGGMNWDNGTNPQQGAIGYDDGTSLMNFRVNNANEMQLSATAISPVLTGGLDIGAVLTRWGTGFINALLVAGALAADADPGANDIIIGDQSGDAGLTINMGANDGELAWNNGTNDRQAALTYVDSASRMDFRVGNVDELSLSNTALGPHTVAGGLDLGTVAVPFGTVFAQAFDLSVASPTFTLGDGTGTPVLLLQKGPADSGIVQWRDGVIDAVNDRRLIQDGSENMLFDRVTSVGPTVWVTDVTIDTSGDVTFANDLLVAGDATANKVLVAGAVAADGVVGNDDIVIGTVGAGSESGITILSDPAGTGVSGISWADVAATKEASLTYDHTNRRMFFNVAASNRLRLDSNSLDPIGTMSLGASAVRWDTGFINTMFVSGADVADGVTGSNNVVVGDGVDTNDYGATFFVGSLAGDIGRIDITATAATQDGWWSYEPNTNAHVWGLAGAAALNLDANGLYPENDSTEGLGLTGNRWGTGFINTVLVSGADVADGVTGSNNVVVGDGVNTNDYGVTLFVGSLAGDTGRIDITAAAATQDGWWEYEPNTNTHVWGLNGAAALNLDATGLFPTANGTEDFGADGNRWDEGFINTVLVSGAVAANGVTGSNNVVVGDGVNTNDYGMTLFVGNLAGDTGRIDITAATATQDGWWSYEPNVDLHEWGVAGAATMTLGAATFDIDVASLTATFGSGVGNNTVRQDAAATGQTILELQEAGTTIWDIRKLGGADGDFRIGRFTTAGGFQDAALTIGNSGGLVTIANNFVVDGATVNLTDANVVLTMGDGTGSPVQTIDAAVASTGRIRFESASALDWTLDKLATSKNFALQRYVVGVFQDVPLLIDNAAGNVTLANNLDLNSASPTLSVGNNTGSPVLALDIDTLGTGAFRFRVEGTTQWGLNVNASDDFSFQRAGSVEVWGADQATGLVSFANSVILDSASPSATFGDGSGSPVIRLDKTAAGTCQVQWFVAGGIVNSKRIRLEADETLAFEDFNGATWDRAMTIDNVADVQIANNLTLDSVGPSLVVGDGTGTLPSIRLNATGNSQFIFLQANTQEVIFQVGATPDLQIAVDVSGSIKNTFYRNATGNWEMPANLALNSASPTLGVGTTSPIVNIAAALGTPEMRFQKLPAGNTIVRFSSGVVETLNDKRFLHDTGENWVVQHFNGATWDTALTVDNSADVQIANDLALNSASPTVTQGIGTGSPTYTFDKLDIGGASVIQFQFEGSLAANAKRILHDTDETFKIQHHNGGGFVDGITLDNSADVLIANALLTAGAAETDGIANADDLIVGDGGATNRGLTLFTDGVGTFAVYGVAATDDGSLAYNAATNLWSLEIGGSGGDYLWTAAAASPASNGGATIGTDPLRWSEGFIDTVLVAGAVAADGVANNANLIIGDGTADVGMTFLGDSTGVSTGISWSEVAGSGADRASIRYDLANERMFFRVSGATARMTLQSNRLEAGSDGVQGLGRTQNIGWNNLTLAERADHFGTPTASRSEDWLRSTAPNTRMVTDDGGADHSITPGPTGSNSTGLVGQRWGVGFINKPHANVLLIGDGVTATLGAEHFVNIVTPTSKSTAELPTAVVGDWYEIDLQDETSSADITPNTGDTINGGSAGVAKNITAAGLYTIYALDDTDWRLFGPLAVTA